MTTVMDYNNEDLLRIARAQKLLVWIFLIGALLVCAAVTTAAVAAARAGSGSQVLPAPWAGLLRAVQIAFWLGAVIFAYWVARALKTRAVWVYVILMLIPCVSLITLLVLNYKATAVLRTHGVHVGLFGAKKEDLGKLGENAS